MMNMFAPSIKKTNYDDDNDKRQWSESGLVHFPKYWLLWITVKMMMTMIKMKTNMTVMTMMTMTRGSGQNQGCSTFPSIGAPPTRLGTHHTLMTRMTMAKWRWQKDNDNKKWSLFNKIWFTIMEIFIHDSGNSDVHSRMTMSYCITIYLRYFFVPIVFLVFAFLLLLCNY